jgi:hypothetical protein
MEPWANPGPVVAMAPDPANAALFAATADGVLHLCLGDASGSFCKVKSPPQDGVRAVMTDPTGLLVFAGADAAHGGLWRFDRVVP